jgi:hypothetical protein
MLSGRLSVRMQEILATYARTSCEAVSGVAHLTQVQSTVPPRPDCQAFGHGLSMQPLLRRRPDPGKSSMPTMDF